jgi:thiol-disulfide isomerase/thioredoxin
MTERQGITRESAVRIAADRAGAQKKRAQGAGRLLAYVVTAMVAALAGYLLHTFVFEASGNDPDTSPPVDSKDQGLVGAPRPDYTLGSADGTIVSASDFDGKVVLVNFWATWCAPCREEMPMLMELRAQHMVAGVEVVGIALDDVQPARDFIAELGVEYPNLVGSTDVMVTMQQYGNATGTLPYSVLIGPGRTIRWTHLGVLDREVLENQIESLLGEI